MSSTTTQADAKIPIPDVYEHEYFGGWVIDQQLGVIRHKEQDYEIDLERVTSHREAWGWIDQVSVKLWCDEASTAGLVRALVSAFGRNPKPLDLKGAQQTAKRIIRQHLIDLEVKRDCVRLAGGSSFWLRPLENFPQCVTGQGTGWHHDYHPNTFRRA